MVQIYHCPIFPKLWKRQSECASAIISHPCGLNFRVGERITILGDQRHVYVSLDKLIDNIMGHGMPLSFIMDDRGNTSNPGGINGCKMIKEMRHKIREDVRNDTKYDPDKTACDSLTLWSDAFITA